MPAGPIQLLCLPHSGASALMFLRWRRALPSWLDVRPVELPGRGARSAEPLRTDLLKLADDLGDELVSGLGDRYALFGHSLGAVLAFELAHALIARGAAIPLALFVSASEAPAVRDDRDLAEPKSDDELLGDLRRLRGTPEEALGDDELMRLVLPILRADFLMCGGYRHRPRAALPCPIHVLGGRGDDIAPGALEAWRDETSAGCDVSLFEGGHFFIHDRESEALRVVVDRLAAIAFTHGDAPSAAVA